MEQTEPNPTATEDRSDFRWLTYPEASRVLGIKAESIARYALKKGWRRREGNDKRVQVAIPLELILRAEAQSEDQEEQAPAIAAVLQNIVDSERQARSELAKVQAELAAAKAVIAVQQSELRRWVRRKPEYRDPAKVIRRLDKLARSIIEPEGSEPTP